MPAYDPKKFPIYKLLKEFNQPGANNLVRSLEHLRTAGDDEKYQLAKSLHILCRTPNIEAALPDFTAEVRATTLRQSFEIFHALGKKGHEAAASMVAACYAEGMGCARDFAKAALWQDKTGDLGVAELLDRKQQDEQNRLENRPARGLNHKP